MINEKAALKLLLGKPLLADAEYTKAIMSLIAEGNMQAFTEGISEDGVPPSSVRDKVLIADIEGPLTYKPRGMCPGLNSYVAMEELAVSAANREDVAMLVLMVDSPGGMAYQAFESAKRARKILDGANKKLITYVDGMSASAMYAWSAVSHEIIANPDAKVGSIGVVVALENDLPAEIAAGKERIFLSYGDNKVPFTEKGNFKKEKLEEIQHEISIIGDKFENFVAEYRGISKQSVKDMQANIFSAEKALGLGLVDKIMEKDEFFSYLNSILKNSKQESHNLLAIVGEGDNVNSEDMVIIKEQLAALKLQNETLVASNSELKGDNEKLVEIFQVIEKEKVEAKLAALKVSVGSMSFIENKEELINVLSKLKENDQNVILSSLHNGNNKLNEKIEKDKKEEEETDLFEMRSAQIVDEPLLSNNVVNKVSKNIINKYKGAKA